MAIRRQGQSGYSLVNGNGDFELTNQTFSGTRIDYVITRHAKSEYQDLESYTLTNDVTVTVEPVDNYYDGPTEAESERMWVYRQPVFSPPSVGNLGVTKYGLDRNNNRATTPEHIRTYSLDSYHNNMPDASGNGVGVPGTVTIGNLAYFTSVGGAVYPHTLPAGANPNDPYAYGVNPVTFTLEDDTVRVSSLIGPYSDVLTADHFYFERVNLVWTVKVPVYDDVEKVYNLHNATTNDWGETDVIEVWAKFGDGGDYVHVANYKLGSSTWDVLSAGTENNVMCAGTMVNFNSKDCTGYRLVHSNAFYSTSLSAYPYVAIKGEPTDPNDPVTQAVAVAYTQTQHEIMVRNTATGAITRSDGGAIHQGTVSGDDYVMGIDRRHDISKTVTFANDPLRQRCRLNWSIEFDEYYLDDNSRTYIKQERGVFYDLLPIGGELDMSTLAIFTNNGQRLQAGEYTVSQRRNYQGSARTMLTIRINVPTDYKYTVSYTTNHSWDSISEYGNHERNSVAYETGNEDLGRGYPDGGAPAGIIDRALLSNLDPNSAGAHRFTYAQASHDIQALMAGNLGLYKQVSAGGDYAYSAVTNSGEDYSYRIRFSTDSASRADQLILVDSLENFEPGGGISSDWHGTLLGFDLSVLESNGIAPVIYYRGDAVWVPSLGIDGDYDFSGWTMASGADDPDLYKAKTWAIDMRWDRNGDRFELPPKTALAVTAFMRAPDTVASDAQTPTAYNNIWLWNRVKFNDEWGVPTLNFQNYTQITYHQVGDLDLLKLDVEEYENNNGNIVPVPGITFRLESDELFYEYDEPVEIELTTGEDGILHFSDLPRGTYTLTEIAGSPDYQALKIPMTVTITRDGTAEIGAYDEDSDSYDYSVYNVDGKQVIGFIDGLWYIGDAPRIHGDLDIMKMKTVDGSDSIIVAPGVKFAVYGYSGYHNEISFEVTSQPNGILEIRDLELGEYEMWEVSSDDTVISDIVYTLKCDTAGVVSLYYEDENGDVVYPLEGNTYTIVNEPLHSFQLWKFNLLTTESVAGAVFNLTGADEGMSFTQDATSGDSGVVTFSGLASGSYVLTEKSVPEPYVLDETSRLVVVGEDGSVSIDGKTLEEWVSEYYETYDVEPPENEEERLHSFPIPNEPPMTGTITIIKVWEGLEEGETPPTPVLHLDTEAPELTANWATIDKAKWASLVNNAEDTLPLRSATSFKEYTSTLADPEGEGWTRIDDEATDKTIWFKLIDGVGYWWSDAERVFLAPDSSEMFAGCSGLTGLESSGGLGRLEATKVYNMHAMFQGCSGLTQLKLGGLNTASVVDMSNLFDSCTGLTVLEVTDWNTAKVTDMSYMFNECHGLTTLDLSSFDTAEVTTMSYMFAMGHVQGAAAGTYFGLGNLTSLDVSHFNTAKVTDMSYMFYGNLALTSLTLWDQANGRGLDTANVQDMSKMFLLCENLTSLDVSHFDTANVQDMSSMFQYCEKLTSLDVSHFDTANVQDMKRMFYYCYALTTLDVSGWRLPVCTDMYSMFYYCKKLGNLDMSHWNAASVTSMPWMFNDCDAMTVIDLSDFNLSTVTDVHYTFAHCDALTTIYASEDWPYTHYETTQYVHNSNGSWLAYSDELTFGSCSAALHGGAGTAWSSGNVSGLYARLDDPANGRPGYFTYKASASGLNPAPAGASSTSNTSSASSVPVLTVPSYDAGSSADDDTQNSGEASAVAAPGDDFAPARRIQPLLRRAPVLLREPDDVGDNPGGDDPGDEPGGDPGEGGEYVPPTGPVQSQVSDDAGWTQLPDGRWSYTFTVHDEDYTYYLWESALDGYTTDTDRYHSIKILYHKADDTHENPWLTVDPESDTRLIEYPEGSGSYAAQITNTKTDDDLASLIVKKTVSGSAGDYTGRFPIRIELGAGDTGIDLADITGTYGDIPFNNGVATVYLSHGESLQATNLPVGLTYTVTETDSRGHVVSYTGCTGTLSAETTPTAIVHNTKGGGSHIYGGFIITKTVVGEMLDANQSFPFTVTLYTDEACTQVATGITGLYGGLSFTQGVANSSLTNGGSVTVSNLLIDTPLYFKVVENVPNGYEVGYVNQSGAVQQTAYLTAAITNTVQDSGGFTLTKSVEGGDGTESFAFYVQMTGLSPNITYSYTLNGTSVSYSSGGAGSPTLSLSLSDGDQAVFAGLPIGATYKVTEGAASGYVISYTVTNSGSGGGIVTPGGANSAPNTSMTTGIEVVEEDEDILIAFTNTYTNVTVDVEGAKTWNDGGNTDNRPASIIIYLKSNGSTAQTKEVTAEDGWAWSFTGLPKFDSSGNEITYTIEEGPVDGYTTQYDGYNVINTPVSELIQIPVTKTWNDGGNADGTRPQSIVVTLYADGAPVGSQTIDASMNWTYTFVELPKYQANGTTEIVYTIGEVAVSGYDSVQSGDAENGFVITNTPLIDISGSKIWVDQNNAHSTRPASITIRLLAKVGSGEPEEVAQATVTAQDDWSWSFFNKPKYDAAGNLITYSITEDTVPLYDTEYPANTYDVTNTYTPDPVSVTLSGTKTFTGWPSGVTAPTFTYKLYEGTTELQTKTRPARATTASTRSRTPRPASTTIR